MEIIEEEIPVGQLRLGMYVSRLDIPWEITSFPLQGLLIESEADIDRLAKKCDTVFVDQARSRRAHQLKHAIVPGHALSQSSKIAPIKLNRGQDWKRRHCIEQYRVSVPMRKELVTATGIFDSIERQLYLICEYTIRCRKAHVEMLLDSTANIVDSIVRNPDAFAWLCRVRATRKPIYMHTIRLAIWGAIVGRQLGLNTYSICHLCFALLMTGIGKSSISTQDLDGYSPKKVTQGYKKHLLETLYQLKEFRFSSQDTLKTIQAYCERYDGSGYPKGIKGDDIPFLSRIAGLIETFELLINPYDTSKAVSPANAIVYLNRAKDQLFEKSLVEEFVKAIGIYPTGTLVELSDGRIGVVYSQDYDKRLRASVIPILSKRGEIISKFKLLDLTGKAGTADDANMISIRKGVPSTTVPRGLLENAHEWMFHKDPGIMSWFKGFR